MYLGFCTFHSGRNNRLTSSTYYFREVGGIGVDVEYHSIGTSMVANCHVWVLVYVGE